MNKLPRVAMFGCNPNISLANATTEIHIKGGKKKQPVSGTGSP